MKIFEQETLKLTNEAITELESSKKHKKSKHLKKKQKEGKGTNKSFWFSNRSIERHFDRRTKRN